MQRAGEECSREKDQPVQRPTEGVGSENSRVRRNGGWSRECAAEDEGGQGRVRLNHWGLLSHPGVSNLRPLGHMQARVAVNAAQHKIINLLKTL